MKKVLFLYKTPRKKIYDDWKDKKGPDTILYGLNHLKKFGYRADFFDTGFYMVNPLRWLSYLINLIAGKTTGVGFNLGQTLTLMPKLNKYDYIISTMDTSGLPLLMLKKIGLLKPKVIYISVDLVLRIKDYNKMLKTFYKNLLKVADLIVCYSPQEEKLLKILNKNVVLMSPGTDFIYYQNMKEPKNKTLKILAFGRDSDRDYKLFFESINGLNFNSEVVASNRNLEGLKIPQNVSVLIDLPAKDLKEKMSAADIVVIPLKSVKRAAGQLSVLDSIAAAKPLITASIPAIKDVFKLCDGEDCLYYKAGSLRDLKAKISKLAKDQKLRISLSNNAKITAQKFTTEIFAKNLAFYLNKL